MWVANYNPPAPTTTRVTELSASTGALVHVLSASSYDSTPDAVSSDGAHVWVANSGGNTVTELSASTGKR